MQNIELPDSKGWHHVNHDRSTGLTDGTAVVAVDQDGGEASQTAAMMLQVQRTPHADRLP